MFVIAIVAAATVATSFLCSLMEAALYSISLLQLESMVERKTMGAHRLRLLRAEIEEPIAAILTVNTIANTVGSAAIGALTAHEMGEAWVAPVAGVMTFLILFVAEIVPKNLGVTYASKVAPWLAWPLQVLIWAVWPIVRVCSVFAALLRGRRGAGEAAPSEAEIIQITRIAARAQNIRVQELRWVENALRLDRVRAGDILTPRAVVYRLPADMPLSMVTQRSEHWVHSRLPVVADDDPDRVLGMVYRREVFDAIARGEFDRTLRDLIHPIDFVPESIKGHELLDKFIHQKKHMAAVLDEYGSFVGLVTLEDVLERLLGTEIVDEHDRVAHLQSEARRRALERLPAEAVESLRNAGFMNGSDRLQPATGVPTGAAQGGADGGG